MGILDKLKKLLEPKYVFDNAPRIVPDTVYQQQFLSRKDWMGQFELNGKTFFRISYYGQLHEKHANLITGTSFAPALVLATEPESATSFVLFDGCRHGYDAMFSDEYTEEQINNRPAETIYTDSNGNDLFELHMRLKYGYDFDDEFGHEVDENGMLELPGGIKRPFETVKWNGFDSIIVLAKNREGKIIPILIEETG